MAQILTCSCGLRDGGSRRRVARCGGPARRRRLCIPRRRHDRNLVVAKRLAHFREEWQTEEGEALRDDENFCHVAAWEYKGDGVAPVRHTEPLSFESSISQPANYK